MPITNYYWDVDTDNVILEEDENGNTIAEYTQEPSLYGELIAQERDGQASFYNFDGQGSTRELTDQNQNVTDTYTYDAFGVEVARTGMTTNPFMYMGARGYYTNGDTSDVYVRTRPYQSASGRWLSLDDAGFVEGTNRYLYVLNSPLDFVDPSGAFRIVAGEVSCPGCGLAGVYWKFEEGTDNEWFLIQRVCISLTMQECREGGGGCCEPKDPTSCSICFYEKLRMVDGRGHDLWKLPYEIPPGTCGTIGFGTTVSEIRAYRGDVIDQDQWKNPAELEFCDFRRIRVGTHRDKAPTYWGQATGAYRSFMLAGWNCCQKTKSIGFLIYGTSGGSGFEVAACGDGTIPDRQLEHITWP